jgi:hemerythrin-like domain-containing protein
MLNSTPPHPLRGDAVNEPRSNDTPIAGTLPLLDRVDATHEQMRYWLGELQSLVNHMEDRGWDTWARDHARSVIDFFSHTARQHHIDVDRQVCPLITGRGDASLETSVDRLRQDQGWLEENWREVLAQLQPVAEGFGGYDVDMLRHAADVYAALLLEHLALEQSAVFPAARASASTQMQAMEMRRGGAQLSATA